MPSDTVERGDDPSDGVVLRCRQGLGSKLADQPVSARRSTRRTPASPLTGRDQSKCARRRRSVVVGEPERELHERRGHAVDDRSRIRDLDTRRRPDARLDDDAPNVPGTQHDRDHIPLTDLVGNGVGERSRERPRRDERVDRREGHGRRA